MDHAARKRLVGEAFRQQFEASPDYWVRAPGRVDLMGSHTDYNAGTVLTLAIDRDTWIAARRRSDETVNLVSLNMDDAASFTPADASGKLDGSWAQYAQAVAIVLRQNGHQLCGFDGVIHGTVPLSSGLSSSAALEVATCTLYNGMCGLGLDPLTIAQLCQRAENDVVGVSCGILDQYSSVMGRAHGAILLDCRSLTHEVASFPEGVSVVICNTCAPRNLKGSEFDTRRAECEAGAAAIGKQFPEVNTLRDATLPQFEAAESSMPPEVARRSRFIIEEIVRVSDMAAALARNDRAAIGELTARSYLGARDLFEIGAPSMEAMMDAMRSGPGLIGARQSGAGWGGCLLAYVDEDESDAFVAHVETDYRQRTGITPEVYVVSAADGAGRIP